MKGEWTFQPSNHVVGSCGGQPVPEHTLRCGWLRHLVIKDTAVTQEVPVVLGTLLGTKGMGQIYSLLYHNQ